MTRTRSALLARRTLVAVAATSAAALLLTACSSGSSTETATTAAPTTAATSAAALPSESVVEEPTGPAALACAAYFELDLLNSNYAGGAVTDGDLTEDEVKADFKASLKQLVAQAQAAVADGSADQKLLNNAERMKKEISSLNKKESLSDLTKKQKAKFAKQSLRVQKACMRAGFDLPADNVTARTAAGL